MARQEHVLSVFVASPADLIDERARLEEVIREHNISWSRQMGVRLELIQWETHAFPGIGEDAQDVINQQVPEDYDIFIGLMWCRFGTPTGRAGSGTAEEFDRAKKRHDENRASVKVMFYFKDAPIAPSAVDADQLAKVAAFCKSLGPQGVLYWSFLSLEDFEKLVRLHLTWQVQSWCATHESDPSQIQADANRAPQAHKSDDDGELGFLDLLELFEDRFAELVQTTDNLTAATSELGERTMSRTDEMDRLRRAAQGSVNVHDAKLILERSAADMDQYAARVGAELPLFSRAVNEGMTALTQAITLSADCSTEATTTTDAQSLCEKARELHQVLIATEGNLDAFRESVGGIPPMTRTINSAKRRVVAVLDQVLLQFRSARGLVGEVQKAANDILAKAVRQTR